MQDNQEMSDEYISMNKYKEILLLRSVDENVKQLAWLYDYYKNKGMKKDGNRVIVECIIGLLELDSDDPGFVKTA